jgi:DME family drug/metabolite transporter
MARLRVLLAAVCFGTTGTAQALGPSIEPVVVGSARIAVGALLLTLVAVLVARADRSPRARLRDRRGTLLIAGGCVAAYQVTFFAAVADTGVAVGTVVAIGSAPAWTGAFDRLTGGDSLSLRWLGATTLACMGVALLILGRGGAQVEPGGVVLAVLAGAGYAAYAVASKRLLDAGYAAETVMAAVFGTGALLVAPLLVLVPSGELVTPGGAALVVYLGVVPTALAYVLFARGLRHLPAGETATLTLAEPLTAALLGVVVLDERPGGVALVGAGLVLVGLLLLALRRAPLRAVPPIVGPA